MISANESRVRKAGGGGGGVGVGGGTGVDTVRFLRRIACAVDICRSSCFLVIVSRCGYTNVSFS